MFHIKAPYISWLAGKFWLGNELALADVYFKQIRCVLELAVAVWTPGLTIAQINQIERVQKCTLHMILGDSYISYDQAKCILGVDNLFDGRYKLYLNLAKKAEKHKKYSNWFHPAEVKVKPNFTTRVDETLLQTKYTPVPFRTETHHFPSSPSCWIISKWKIKYQLC